MFSIIELHWNPLPLCELVPLELMLSIVHALLMQNNNTLDFFWCEPALRGVALHPSPPPQKRKISPGIQRCPHPSQILNRLTGAAVAAAAILAFTAGFLLHMHELRCAL